MAGIVWVDTSELRIAIQSYADRGKNLGKLTPVIAEILKSGVENVFEAEGPGWQDLAESTQKARRGDSYKILQDTGAMAGEIGVRSGADWSEAYSAASYAGFHVTGTEKMPRRDPFDLGPFEGGVMNEVEDLVLGELTA